MFRIRVFTPAVINADGWRHAGAELVAGEVRKVFLLDLTWWEVASYQQQWQEGIARLVGGAPSSALVSSYRGPSEARHDMWALWREENDVYVQAHTVLTAESDELFNASSPYVHVGERIPATENILPIPEWRFDLTDLLSASFGIRWPS